MKALIEIRAGEGGTDAKLLVIEQARIYTRYLESAGASANILSEARSGLG